MTAVLIKTITFYLPTHLLYHQCFLIDTPDQGLNLPYNFANSHITFTHLEEIYNLEYSLPIHDDANLSPNT